MSAPPNDALDLCPSRRALLRSLAAVGVGTIAAGVLTACGGSGGSGGPSTAGGAGGPGGAGSATIPSGSSIATSQVPVGQAVVVAIGSSAVVLAQPTAGQFVGFSAACTHQGTTVQAVGGLQLECPSHGSRFNGATGQVEQGPATASLPSVKVTTQGNRLVIG